MKRTEDYFYIGWKDDNLQPVNPVMRVFLGFLILLVIIVAGSLVMSQEGFDDSEFELGILTEMQGVYTGNPVPRLKIKHNDRVKSVLLLGFGKFGAMRDIERIEANTGTSLEGKMLTLKGTRIYYRDRQLLELTLGEDSFIEMTENDDPLEVSITKLGEVSIKGEIYDPKCALGVMKPGYGKPHRSCAIRCISGGIPPILHSISPDDGQSYYFILKGPDGQTINESLLEYVADQVKICGRIETRDDWLILYTDPEDIQRLQPYWMDAPLVMCANEI